jgi:glycosyltransferase involved in cell wall biosynthesis/ADP-heptose:LPS heptosyltransferase
MRLVIDMQGAQTGSRFRGIGRYSLSLAKGIVRNRGDHEVLLALSGLFPETLDAIRAEFNGLLPQENIRVWHAFAPTRENDSSNKLRREVSERIREAFLASLQPDTVLVTSLFEGFGDDAVGSIDVLNDRIPTAVILYDLIPLLNPDENFRSSAIHQKWYRRKIAWLKRSQKLLAISESARQEALGTGRFHENSVINISGACDDSFRILNLSNRERSALWKQLGISKAFVMYTGGADERKNLHRLIESYAQMPKGVRQGHQLVLAGKMPSGNVNRYLQTAKDCGLSDSDVVMTGYVSDDDLIKLYNTCALFVFPSLHEGFGLPPLEAMACGAPVIGADATSLPEVIGLGEAMFDPTSVSQISAKMTQALTDEDFRTRLIRHGKSQFRTFSWDKSAKSALDALLDFGNQVGSHVSPLLNVEKTSLFEKRRLRILAVKLDHMGDFILAIPALAKLRARYPYASIDLVVGSWNVPIAEQMGYFDRVYAYDFFRRKSSENPSTTAEGLAALLSSLGTYDIAIDLRRQADTRFLLMRVNADFKIGYETLDEVIDGGLDIAIRSYSDVPFKSTPLNTTSIASQMLKIVDALPQNINDFISFPDIAKSEAPEQGTIAIFPKAGSAAREWSKSNFVELVDLLADDPLVKGINVYFANDREASEFAFQPYGRLKVHVGLAFLALAGSLSRNTICIANNSGGGHLAAYLGLTVIGIYSGHELPSEWAPQFFDSNVIHRGAACSPCHLAEISDCPNGYFCLNDISVRDVYAKAIEAVYRQHKHLEGTPNATHQRISPQRNTDLIVKHLVSSIADLLDERGDQNTLMEIANVIAKNHPTFSDARSFVAISADRDVNHKSSLIEWSGFSGIEPEYRWTDGNRAAMLFECPEGMPERGVLTLLIDTLGPQRLIARLNGKQVIDTVVDGSHIRLDMHVTNIEGDRNKLEFELPDAKVPGNGDLRQLAIAIRKFKIQVKPDNTTAIAEA